MNDDFNRTAALIAAEIGAGREQAAAAIRLLDEGSTVPFIARYRKEATGGLDDTQLRLLAERLVYLRELDARRAAILEFDPRSGQADRRAGGEDRRRRHQGGTGRHLSALQAQAAHASGNRPRARPRPARRGDPGRPLARTGGGGAGLPDRRGQGREGGARGRARHRLRNHGRQRRTWSAGCATYMKDKAFLRAKAIEGQAGSRREILRLFRSRRALGAGSQPPRAGDAARTQRRRPVARNRGRRRRSLARQAGRADDRGRLPHRARGARRSLADGGRALGVAGQALAIALASIS